MKHKPGYGGRRAGAGRKPNPSARPINEIPPPPIIEPSVAALLEGFASTAVKVLVHIAVNGTNESARVSAAGKLLDRVRIKAADAKADTDPPAAGKIIDPDSWDGILQ
jgi:hypothetical protein